MTIATLSQVLQPALKQGYAVPGLVCLGWEDMRAYVAAAEAEQAPIILQAGPGCRAHTPLPILAKMFRHLAENASVPVVAHLDHGYTFDECKEAVECGFTSIMYDGSRKPLHQNIDETAAVAELAKSAGISCEGEIGFVGYANGEQSAGTDPQEAAKFAQATGIDAMAISVGNTHLQEDAGSELDIEKINEIGSQTTVPLVIHGGSGVAYEQRALLSQKTNICKFNIGTELRMAFGNALRETVNSNPKQFDRVELLKPTHNPVMQVTREVIKSMARK